jgi:hypothetical protein
MSVGNLFLHDSFRNSNGKPPIPSHPPPSSQSMSLDLNKLPLRYVDDNDMEHRERRKKLIEESVSSPLALHPDFDDEDDDYLIRLSVIQTNDSNGLDHEADLNSSIENTEEVNDGERFCFSGWVSLAVSSKKQKKCWLRLRGDELSFFEDDTVRYRVFISIIKF